MALFKFLLVASIFAFGLISANPLSRTDEIDSKIVGGYETTIEKQPWQVSLRSFGSHTCGGSIIGDRWVLSAAHCSANSIRVGSSYKTEGGEIVQVKRYIRHQSYLSRTGDYDYALLELATPLNFTEAVQPVALPDADYEVEDDIFALVSGWGATHNSSESNYQLRAARVPIVNQDHCTEQYEDFDEYYQITDRMICAGFEKGGKDACQGDSGGPLVEFETGVPLLVGVVSWGNGCAVPHYAGVYSRVTEAREWIRSTSGI